jgi:glycosyltransferase involved in cell wall biosynthesis
LAADNDRWKIDMQSSSYSKHTGKRPQIVYVVLSLNLGGAEQLVVKMSQAFAPEFDMSVVCLDEPGIWAGKLRQQDIPVHCLWRQPGLDLRVVKKIADYCRENTIDIIHAHQASPWFYASLSRLLYSKPRLIFEEHGRLYPEVKSTKKNIFNRIVLQPLTHRIVAVSKDIGDRLTTYEGLSQNRIEVIYNGSNPAKKLTELEKLELRQSLGFQSDDFIVGTVGRFDPIKNLPMLVEAISEARKKKPNIKGLLIGDGPEFENIKRQIQGLSLTEVIKLPGYRSDAAKLVQCSDLFSLCSLSEGTSMALLDAMAGGIPSIVTEVGGNPEIVKKWETGWVIPSRDTGQLVNVIHEAVSQPEKAAKFAAAGMHRFTEHFTFERMVEQYRRMYYELMG